MKSLVRKNSNLWDPFDMFTDLQDEMNRAFGRTLSRRDGWTQTFSPTLDVQEEADKFVIHADLPGMKKEDLNISALGNQLTLKGERKHDKENKEKDYHYSERSYGAFCRAIQLPTEVDTGKIQATYKDGVLELTLPKSENAKPKQISIEVK